MKLAKWALLAAFAASAGSSAAEAQDSRQAEANAAFTVYPKESLQKGEEGTVHYKVRIDPRGRPYECEVTQSSGHSRLDLATCNMLMQQARFTPSRDKRGKAVRFVYEGRVVWRIS